MISKRTVLVLGAGASKPYGFPTARDIVDVAYAEREFGGPLTDTLTAVGYNSREIRAFFRRLIISGQSSVDAFLERQPDFKPIGKAFIVAQLLPLEDVDRLCDVERAVDWYGHFFARLCPPTPERFREHQLSVVTFNFDRSFEERLFITLNANYDLSEADAANLTRAVPVVHVHGQLGAASWLEGAGRHYVPSTNPADVRTYAEQIRLVSDEIETATLDCVRRSVESADVICFLGFGFHEDNLGRFGVSGLGNKTLYGTCKGLPNAERARVYRYLNSPRLEYLLDVSVRDFFDEIDLFSR